MPTKAEFIRDWIQSESIPSPSKSWREALPGKDFDGVPSFYIFVDMDYFGLLAPVKWESTPAPYKRSAITVPYGFVTDFASVPRLFWSIFPPIGRYGYAALFHDYVYWEQKLTRREADAVFKATMQELGVPDWKTMILFGAVRLFGFVAWRGNAVLKTRGEKRILKAFPNNLTTSWRTWKMDPRAYG
jgi:Protein of unknown function (DUF1353)